MKKQLTKSYSEKLKDPRWQKKRLEILQRDNFACRSCTCKDSTLHVHHLEYEKGQDPWEYDNDSLITLCEDCHEIWTYIYNKSNFPTDLIWAVVDLYGNLEHTSLNKEISNIQEANDLNF